MTTPLDYLLSLEHFGIKFGLENIRAIAGGLGHPERAFQSVHIAGTNGKGSVTAMVDAALRAAGHRSARYTSPHLVSLTERFVVAGQEVSEDQLSGAVERVRDAIADLQARGALAVHPTFFEVTTAAAFELFRDAKVEIAVCEVGLGGRLDATNVLSPVATAITSIALDHQQYLGTSLAEIAAEKAGIIKPGVPVVVGRLSTDAAPVIVEAARRAGAPLLWAHDGVDAQAAGLTPDGGQRIALRTPARNYGIVDLRLAGRHQIDNAVVAVRVLEAVDAAGIGVPQSAVVKGLADVDWPGRLEPIHLPDGRSLLLDAAHNPAGAEALAGFLAECQKSPLVFAAMRDKDARAILARLAPYISALVLTRATTPRSTPPESLQQIAQSVAPHLPIQTAPSIRDALAAAWKLNRHVVVAGSIFLLGDVLAELESSGAVSSRHSKAPGSRGT